MCRILNYFEHLLIFISAVGGCVSIFAFTSLVGFLVGITSFVAGLKICTLTAGNKKYQSIIKRKKQNHDNIMLLARTKLNTIVALISKFLIDSYINHSEFVSVNNVLTKNDEKKGKIENLTNSVEYTT